jgi:hypothetical protein
MEEAASAIPACLGFFDLKSPLTPVCLLVPSFLGYVNFMVDIIVLLPFLLRNSCITDANTYSGQGTT